MYDVWDVLANDDSVERQNIRTATAMANKRVKDRFAIFLATDTEARFEYAKDDIEAVVAATAEEYGVDPKPILAAILTSLTPKQEVSQRTAAVVEARKPKLCPYHSEVMDISLADGNPRAGFDAMAQHAWSAQHCKGPDYEGGKCNFRREFTSTDYWDQKAEQAEERKREREEQRELTLQQEQDTEDQIVEDTAPETVPEEVADPVAEDSGTEDTVVEVDFGTEEVDGEPSAVGEGAPEELAVAASTDDPFHHEANVCPYCAGVGQFGGTTCPHCGGTGQEGVGVGAPVHPAVAMVKEAPGGQHREEWGEGGSKRNRQYEHILESCKKEHPDYSEDRCKELAASTTNKTRSEHGETKSHVERMAEALETVDIEKDSMPKFKKDIHDKTVPDSEMDGSPHPTKTVDPTEPIIPDNNDDGLAETDAVLEKQDVTKADSAQKGKGGTFPKGNGANPVTSSVSECPHCHQPLDPNEDSDECEHCGKNINRQPVESAADVNVNPVREILLEDDEDGFLGDDDVVAAIRRR